MVCLQVPVLNNAQMQTCADGAAGSMQLWTRNYVLSSGTASISSMAQVPGLSSRHMHAAVALHAERTNKLRS